MAMDEGIRILIGNWTQWSVYGWLNKNLNEKDDHQWMWHLMGSECITNIFWDMGCLRTRNYMFNEYVMKIEFVWI